MVSNVVHLRDDFSVEAERYSAIKRGLASPHIISSCCVRSDLLRKAADPNYNIEGSNASLLKQLGLLDVDRQMPDDVRRMTLLAFGYESAEAVPAQYRAGGGSCLYMNMDNLSL